MDVRIRDESPQDVAAIHELTVAAFLDAAHTDHAEQFIVGALRASGQLAVSLVAECEGALLGHVALSPVAVSDGSTLWYGLGPLSVMPAQQGQGIGTQLVQQALSELRRRGASGCVVLGEPGYYARFGFKAAPSLTLPGVPPEYFQVISFMPHLPTGTVKYHESFSVS